MNLSELANNIKLWGKELGFDQVGITDIDLKAHESYLKNWLDKATTVIWTGWLDTA
ncbi:hypothetical protein JCM19233_6816 [Vibrio astriarenae]|nr:hypothetical protein JCM19233_6816 [Vibrio sp. C7]